MSKAYIYRKCRKCKESFNLSNTDYIKNKTTYFHTDCYIESNLEKGLSVNVIEERIKIIKEEMKKDQERRDNASRSQINRSRDKDSFYEYIMDKYNVSSIPKTFFLKVAAINNGTHPTVKYAIPYDELLFMFKKQEQYLLKTRMRNPKFANGTDGMSCLNYDLAVIVGMYESYLRWKHKQEVLSYDISEKEETKTKQPKMDLDKLEKQSKLNQDDDINDIIDDIY